LNDSGAFVGSNSYQGAIHSVPTPPESSAAGRIALSKLDPNSNWPLRFATIGNEGIVPKERIRERSRESRRRDGRLGLDDRKRDTSCPVHEKRGDTRVDTLRQTYGEGFAPGVRGDTHLKTLLDRTGSSSLSEYLKTAGQSPVRRSGTEDRAGQKPPGIRYASDERFREAHRKTSASHAGLFHRLAE